MNEIMIALDFSSKKEAMTLIEKFDDESMYLKVGMELFYAEGKDFIRILKEKGHQIFLDLKLHDIPNTVYRAMKNLASLEIDMINVHASGGKEMMIAAKKGLEDGTKEGAQRQLLIAVTQLTSTTEAQMKSEQFVSGTLEESVLRYAKLANEAGLDGVVCSAWEAEGIHEVTDSKFICVIPGIRPKDFEADDQKRVATPRMARELGASCIVVGRPITQVMDSVATYRSIKKQWEEVN
ncbi:orotidine-5'-phosphate decarboxylase [Lacticigenium naphthae]|uniref:orotidine-5'-phosphate decarboxylase n=1 Tax=Lacticigenium naphthae TaxID=515351 RepID=UPI0004216D1A|nr:orotidine-5'-phosphate decarboxylase [Lacticigenium naphthae]